MVTDALKFLRCYVRAPEILLPLQRPPTPWLAAPLARSTLLRAPAAMTPRPTPRPTPRHTAPAAGQGGMVPEKFCVPSRENFSKVLDTIAMLVSGDGITCPYRGGAFDAGVLYTTRSDLDEALR